MVFFYRWLFQAAGTINYALVVFTSFVKLYRTAGTIKIVVVVNIVIYVWG